MLDRARPRDRQHHGRALQEPRDRGLPHGNAVPVGYALERMPRVRALGMAAGAERRPRKKRDRLALAVGEHVLGMAVLEVVAVLDGDDGCQPLATPELLDADVRDADVPDLAFPL